MVRRRHRRRACVRASVRADTCARPCLRSACSVFVCVYVLNFQSHSRVRVRVDRKVRPRVYGRVQCAKCKRTHTLESHLRGREDGPTAETGGGRDGAAHVCGAICICSLNVGGGGGGRPNRSCSRRTHAFERSHIMALACS